MRTRIPLAHNESSISYFIAPKVPSRRAVKRWATNGRFNMALPPLGGMRNPRTDFVTYIAADQPIIYRAR